MCGIYGYVNKTDKKPQEIVEGLKLLEYRGYDSWGVAVRVKNKDGHVFAVEKHVGKIGIGKLSKELIDAHSTIGIGHTRWATHGGVTERNAHPHTDCTKQIAVVHNGIIENYQQLKEELEKKEHIFKSETDTEVIPHLIEEYSKKEGFASSVRDAFNRFAGLNAIVVANAKSSEIIACKTGSPLVVGVADDGFYIASDATGIVKHTKDVVFLKDKEMVILGKKLQLFSLPEGKKIPAISQVIDWDFEVSDKGKYKHYFMKEVFEQPKILKHIAQNSLNDTKKLAELIEKAFGTFLLACGSAAHAGLTATYLFSSVAKKHVNFSIASEFEYLEDYITSQTLVIPISQSGESVDVIDPVMKAKQKKGSVIAALVNVLGSTLYREADYKFLLNAGPEISVTATKSFIAMYAMLLLTAYTLIDKQKEGQKLLEDAAISLKEILSDKNIKTIKKVTKDLSKKEHIYIIGRGLSHITALEAALKIKEISYVHAEGFAGGDLKHGVIALIDRGTPCIVFAPNDNTYDEIVSNAMEVKTRGGYIIGIGPRNNDVFDVFLSTEDLREATLIPQVVISQLLAYHLALARGVEDPDKPRNLAKSVTVK